MLDRLLILIIKELQILLGSARGRALLIVPVLLQTAVFPFAATLEVRNATLALYLDDAGLPARDLASALAQASAFGEVLVLRSDAALRDAIDNQKALLAVRIPAGYSSRLARHETASLQVILDGRRSNSGQIAAAYVSRIAASEAAAHDIPAPVLHVRNLYNPQVDYRWHVLPSLVAIITTIGCLIVTALSVAREREEGTFEQLLVSPLTPGWIMAGKAIPGILLAMAQAGTIALVAMFLYGVPFTGSLPALFAGMFCYGLSLSGVGLFISALCSRQQQALLGMFTFMVPAVILSGYVSPVENMPPLLQWLAHANPLAHFIPLLKAVFLKGAGVQDVGSELGAMLLIASLTLAAAYGVFRRQTA